MANPLMNRQQNTSKADMADRPQPIDPEPEHYAGENFPYRGIEYHGVEPTAEPRETPGYDATVGAEFKEVKEPETPVPVKIVTEGLKEINDWQVRREYVSGASYCIAGRNNNRTRLTIRNAGAVNVWVGSNGSVTSFMGYPIVPNAELTLNKAVTPVYAVSDDGTQQPVIIVEEFVRNE